MRYTIGTPVFRKNFRSLAHLCGHVSTVSPLIAIDANGRKEALFSCVLLFLLYSIRLYREPLTVGALSFTAGGLLLPYCFSLVAVDGNVLKSIQSYSAANQNRQKRRRVALRELR